MKALREKRGDKGEYVFSTDSGKRPIGNFSKLKGDLDAKIKELAPDAEMPAWRLHDLRRTVRTNLGAIPSIPQDVRELVIAHVPQPSSKRMTCMATATKSAKPCRYGRTVWHKSSTHRLLGKTL